MIKIFAVQVEPYLDKPTFSKLKLKLPTQSQSRIDRFVRYEDALRALLGEILVRTLVRNRLHISYSDIHIIRDSYGKPQLLDYPDFCFNLSHSGQWVVCAIDSYPVGIDIQRMNPPSLEIARRFFSTIEYSDLINSPEHEQSSYFYDLWTCKESYIKAIGVGLSMPLQSFSIRIDGEQIELITAHMHAPLHLKQYSWGSDYKLAVCAAIHRKFPEEVETIGVDLLCDRMLNT